MAITTSKNLTEKEKEALKFLERDFNQCFQQMRYYDSQIFDTLKFMFTAYTALIGIAIGFYEFGLKEHINLYYPTLFALSIGLIIGEFVFILAIRNREYFVAMARYINEQRGLFFEYKPADFINNSRMYTDCTKPPFYTWKSSQAWFINLIAFLNMLLLSTVSYFVFINFRNKLSIIIVASLLLLIVQIGAAIAYLKSKENKSTDEAIFGRKK